MSSEQIPGVSQNFKGIVSVYFYHIYIYVLRRKSLAISSNGLNRFKPSNKIFYWPFQGGTSFVDRLCFFCLVFAMPLWVSVYMCLVVTCQERAEPLALVCGVQMWVCYFPIGILGQVCYLIVSIPDLCTLTWVVWKWSNSYLQRSKDKSCYFIATIWSEHFNFKHYSTEREIIWKIRFST